MALISIDKRMQFNCYIQKSAGIHDLAFFLPIFAVPGMYKIGNYHYFFLEKKIISIFLCNLMVYFDVGIKNVKEKGYEDSIGRR